ncbi:hypothetical protein GCM10023066_46190 [Nocardioides kongjuensis]
MPASTRWWANEIWRSSLTRQNNLGIMTSHFLRRYDPGQVQRLERASSLSAPGWSARVLVVGMEAAGLPGSNAAAPPQF